MQMRSMLTLVLFCTALAPGVALAQERQMQERPAQGWQTPGQDANACMGDAMSVCGQFIPDRERVAHCLLANRLRVSASCRVALTHWRS